MMKIKLHPLMSEFWLEKADSIIAFHEFRLELRSGAHWKSLHWKSYVGLHFNVKISKKKLVWFYKPGELTYRGNKLWERKNKNLRWPGLFETKAINDCGIQVDFYTVATKVVLVLPKVAWANSCVTVITQGSAHATLRSTRTTFVATV